MQCLSGSLDSDTKSPQYKRGDLVLYADFDSNLLNVGDSYTKPAIVISCEQRTNTFVKLHKPYLFVLYCPIKGIIFRSENEIMLLSKEVGTSEKNNQKNQ